MRVALPQLILGVCLIAFLAAVPVQRSWAESAYQGPEKCDKCHKAEIAVWEETKHATSLRTMHRTDEAKAIIKAVGGKRVKTNETCTVCHYTMVETNGRLRANAGPSCESCHGASTAWLSIHNDYGEGVKRETESAEHRQMRIERAEAAGMIWPFRTFDVAANCFSCHGMSNDAISGDTIATMLDAGHPINPGFELIRYSQGTVRHRFYPPNLEENATMTPEQLARWFITGHAVSLVVATEALGRSDHPKYQAAQNGRIEAAKAALEAIRGQVPEAGALLQDPSEASARALVAAIESRDLSGAVGGLLPPSDGYK